MQVSQKSPYQDPIFGRQPHPVAFRAPVGFIELRELLHHRIDADIVAKQAHPRSFFRLSLIVPKYVFPDY